MGSKRNNEATSDSSGRPNKRSKLEASRSIAVQSATPASHQIPGPSASSTASSSKQLPSALDVEKFTEARAFEINAMHSAIKAAASNSTQRAWQALPRHLRRRAASHDVRRVPLRLRDKARAEMDPVRQKTSKSIPKRGKERMISRTKSFLNRQRDKRWLETHLWHAKRMHMKNLWGYRLAITPTEKSFRPSHRASIHGSILHDASYQCLIELKGPEGLLASMLKLCCDPQGPGPDAVRFLNGARVLETYIYALDLYPIGLIAPATVMWRPVDSSTTSSVQPCSADESSSQRDSIMNEDRGKTKEVDVAQNATSAPRTVWVRSHPLVFDELFKILQCCASRVLDGLQELRDNGNRPEIEVADLRGQVNIFEIMGPKASQVMKGALTPAAKGKSKVFDKFWSSLVDIQTSGSVPREMVIGLKVLDPRLKFPPKNAKSNPVDPLCLSPVACCPTADLARSELWDEKAREAVKLPKYKKSQIDERRSKNLIPGTPLSPLRQDDRIPALLIQRSLKPSLANTRKLDSLGIHGWTFVFPAGWAMPFLNSFTYTGTRVGGQSERQTQAFEAGMAYFPRDYPGTNAYRVESESKAQEEQAKWERKPPAKRPNYVKLGTRSPWKADWDVVLGLQAPFHNNNEGGLVTTQREEEAMAMDVSTSNSIDPVSIRPWILRGTLAADIFMVTNPGASILSKINELRSKRSESPLDVGLSDGLWKSALVTVQVRMCSRGAPQDLAIIYGLRDTEACRWNQALQKKCVGTGDPLAEETPAETELADLKPPHDAIIGYVTTGSFSLSRGEGFSIGAVPAVQFFSLQRQAHRLHANRTKLNNPPPLLVKVRDRDGHKCRPAHLALLVS